MDQVGKKYNNHCPKCSEPFEIELLEPGFGMKSNITVDRINNTLSHIKSNCSLLCMRCNVTKRDDGPGKVLSKYKKIEKQEKMFNLNQGDIEITFDE